jgi:hypothetical protein
MQPMEYLVVHYYLPNGKLLKIHPELYAIANRGH